MQANNITVLIPVYNDWVSLSLMVQGIKKNLCDKKNAKVSLLFVNDCSTIKNDKEEVFEKLTPFFLSIKTIDLVKNIGHQKAIAVGLAYIAENVKCDTVIVMDADGEDKPEHLTELVEASIRNKNKIIFAKRTKRNESIFFKFFYRIYKFIFKIFTGETINFGNFCVIPFEKLKNVVYIPEIWIHFSGGIIRSKINYTTIPLERGKRLTDKSKMNFISLIVHGLSSIAVHIEIVLARLLILILLLIFLSVLSIIVIVALKIFTYTAISGWTILSVFGIFIILLQVFFTSLILFIFILHHRTQKPFIPGMDYKYHILKIEEIGNE